MEWDLSLSFRLKDLEMDITRVEKGNYSAIDYPKVPVD